MDVAGRLAIVSRFSPHRKYYPAYVCLLLDLGIRCPVVFFSSFRTLFWSLNPPCRTIRVGNAGCSQSVVGKRGNEMESIRQEHHIISSFCQPVAVRHCCLVLWSYFWRNTHIQLSYLTNRLVYVAPECPPRRHGESQSRYPSVKRGRSPR